MNWHLQRRVPAPVYAPPYIQINWCHCFFMASPCFCRAGDLNRPSVLSRWCTTTCEPWATRTLRECSRKRPTRTSVVWSGSTAVSTVGPRCGWSSVGLKAGRGGSDAPRRFHRTLLELVFACASRDQVKRSCRLRLSEHDALCLGFITAWNIAGTHPSQPHDKWLTILHPVACLYPHVDWLLPSVVSQLPWPKDYSD